MGATNSSCFSRSLKNWLVQVNDVMLYCLKIGIDNILWTLNIKNLCSFFYLETHISFSYLVRDLREDKCILIFRNQQQNEKNKAPSWQVPHLGQIKRFHPSAYGESPKNADASIFTAAVFCRRSTLMVEGESNKETV